MQANYDDPRHFYEAPYAPSATSQPHVNNLVVAPKQPDIITRVNEMLSYISELEFEDGLMRAGLFGEGESMSGRDKNPNTPPLEQMLADCCQRLANLVGSAKTVNRKIGVQDPRQQPATSSRVG